MLTDGAVRQFSEESSKDYNVVITLSYLAPFPSGLLVQLSLSPERDSV